MDETEIYRIKYTHKRKTITTKYMFPSVQNFLDWSKLHGDPFEEYKNVELVEE
jgi:hypothetical protein